MANNFNANPLYITNAFQSYKAQVASVLGTLFTFRFTKFYWLDPLNQGDELHIVGSNGMDILTLRCESSNQSQIVDWTPAPLLVQDWSVPRIDSGTLFVYYLL